MYILSLIHLIYRPACNEPPLDTNKFAIQDNKCILKYVTNVLWYYKQRQSEKLKIPQTENVLLHKCFIISLFVLFYWL